MAGDLTAFMETLPIKSQKTRVWRWWRSTQGEMFPKSLEMFWFS